ncbi:magnesium/cobalt transporter CorA [Methanofollis tationis]|uniref:Magnesium transport protein CorA n=1 Tax=Methanofollis tationis TaxID=81417 RepID=A0A7K4HL41_9EURY|nr:magnesium/cobalt transporter CorA [Methanofollis tationis]NVO65892.1 magnesium/cobalt transporter CorA [Methanofollis tationis]
MTGAVMKRSQKAGLPPGSLVYVGDEAAARTTIDVIDYTQEQIDEISVLNAGDLAAYRDRDTVTWINVTGLHEVGVIEKTGEIFGLHPLILEDILNTEQRPKMEEYDETIYVVMKMIGYLEDGKVVDEQISLVLGDRYVISFQERPGDVFDPVCERIRSPKWRARQRGADYLAYALIDTIVDEYFHVIERFGERIEAVDDLIIADPDPKTIRSIRELRRELIFLRKSVWPMREVISGLERSDSTLITHQTRLYLRDVYDHTIQVIDTLETYRDMAAGMLDIYLSSASNRMNEVMKVLTIIATIFIPLSFIAGVFGMNFQHMPELEWGYGYPASLALMAGVALVLLIYFRRKRWI